MNIMHVVQLTFFKAEMEERSCGFCYFSVLTPHLQEEKGYVKIWNVTLKEKFQNLIKIEVWGLIPFLYPDFRF